MSGGFFRVEADWWRATRERLGGQWLLEDALTDLRWWQDQVLAGHEKRIPSHRDLAKYWGWGEKRARLLLARVEEWSDPRKLDAWREHRGHTEGTPRAHRGHTEGTPAVGPTSNIGDKGHTEGTPRTQEGHAKGDARDPLHNHRHRPQPEREPPQPPRDDPPPEQASLSPAGQDPPDKPSPAFEEAARVALQAIWGEEVADLAACTAEVMLVRTLWVARGRPDPAALGADVARVARWAQEAPDAENDLRGRDATGAQWAPDRSRNAGTLLNVERFGDRLRAAVRWERQRDGPTGPARSRRRDPRRELTPEQLAEGERALEQLRQQRAAQEAQ